MRREIILLIFLLFSISAQSQKYGKNIPRYEYRHWVFGTALGLNWTSYKYELNPYSEETKSIKNIAVERGPGMSIQIPLISYNPHHIVNFQFKPSITFHETVFTYQYLDNNDELATKSTRTEPTNLNFPLYLKLNTMRINNFSAFALGGFSYSYDLASQEDVMQSLGDPIVKMIPHDWQYHVGGGFDFYLPYFKLGIELKTSNGINNLLIQDNTFFAAPLSSLKSRMWWFSITFEG